MADTLQFAQHGLANRVDKEIRSRWLEIPVFDRTFRTPLNRYDKLARTTLAAMLVRKFRVKKLPDPEERELVLARVRHWVRRSQPIRITLGYAPMKNQNAVSYNHCDWAEFLSFCHLAAWNQKIQTVYPPGLTIRLVFDDSTVMIANGTARSYTDAYINSVRKLIRAMRYERLIVGVVRHSSFSWLFRFGLLQLARRRMRRWDQQPENQEQIRIMAEYARRNLLTTSTLSGEEEQTRCHEAGHRYRVYFEAMRMSGVTRIGKSVVAMYMDGAQHHPPIRPALRLATLHKELVTQPWQGAGAFENNGRCRLVPHVLTASRLDKHPTDTVLVPNLLELPGFQQVQVVYRPQSRQAKVPDRAVQSKAA